MDLSVVIPTRDRLPILRRTLVGLAGQELGETTAEIVVVDNGSTDGTLDTIRAAEGDFALPLRALHEPRPGASAARNAGLAAAKGDVVLFLGDDTRPAHARLLRSHADLHRERPDAEFALLGRVAWAPELEVTPLMRWLDTGPQFAYSVMTAGPAGPQHFYTAHVSIKRDLLLAAGGFDTSIPFLYEDHELAHRLAELGMALEYHPELLVHHEHPITLAGWIRRQEIAGRAGRRANAIRRTDVPLAPEAANFRRRLNRVLTTVGTRLPGDLGWVPAPLRERLYKEIHDGTYSRAYAAADAHG